MQHHFYFIIFTAAIDGGYSHTHINKLLSTSNLPIISWSVYQTHEKEVGNVVEELAKESCQKAASEERELTIKNEKHLQKML